MGSVSPEICRDSYKYGIINFDTLVHLVGYFCMNCSDESLTSIEGDEYLKFLKFSKHFSGIFFSQHSHSLLYIYFHMNCFNFILYNFCGGRDSSRASPEYSLQH
jgi:hypothetical protein